MKTFGWIYKEAMIYLGLGIAIENMDIFIAEEEMKLMKPFQNLTEIDYPFKDLYHGTCTCH